MRVFLIEKWLPLVGEFRIFNWKNVAFESFRKIT
jgi:hypothetical protein